MIKEVRMSLKSIVQLENTKEGIYITKYTKLNTFIINYYYYYYLFLLLFIIEIILL